MPFPFRLLTLLVGICWSGFLCSAQSPADAFHWDWNASAELTPKDSISQSRALAAKVRAGLIEAVALQLRPLMSDLDIKSERQLREIAAQTRIKAVDLSGKGVKGGASGSEKQRFREILVNLRKDEKAPGATGY